MQRVLISILLVGLLCGAVVGAATGDDGDHPLMPAPASFGTEQPAVAPSARSPQQVLKYWTRERMKDARPTPRLSDTHRHRSSEALPGDTLAAGQPSSASGFRMRASSGKRPPLRAKQPPRSSLPLQPPGTRTTQHAPSYSLPVEWADWKWSAQVVRIYFTTASGRGATCSGSVVAVNVIVTAAHCIYDGGWASNWAVVPGQWGSWGLPGTGTGYGSWAARTATVWPYWQSDTSFYPYDYGFLVLNPNGQGQHIGNVVGTTPLIANLPMSLNKTYMWAFGYPAAGWFEEWGGQYTYSCWSAYTDWAEVKYAGYYEIGMGCYATGGASGGPKYTYYQGAWYVASVVSHGQDSASSGRYWGINEYGPYFNNDTLALYNYTLTL